MSRAEEYEILVISYYTRFYLDSRTRVDFKFVNIGL